MSENVKVLDDVLKVDVAEILAAVGVTNSHTKEIIEKPGKIAFGTSTTGSTNARRTIAHGLGVEPRLIVVMRTNSPYSPSTSTSAPSSSTTAYHQLSCAVAIKNGDDYDCYYNGVRPSRSSYSSSSGTRYYIYTTHYHYTPTSSTTTFTNTYKIIDISDTAFKTPSVLHSNNDLLWIAVA